MRDPVGGGVTIQACNPEIGCTAGAPPTVSFNPPLSGAVTTAAPITVTITWCDDGGLVQSSRSVKLNGVTQSSTYTSSSKTGCWQHGTSVVQITPVVGSNIVTASIKDNFQQTGSSYLSFTYRQLTVSPKGVAIQKPANVPTSQSFTIQNHRSISNTYNLTALCPNSSLGCSSQSQATVAAGGSVAVNVSYSTQAFNSADSVKLRVASTSYSTDVDTGKIVVTASQFATSASFANNVNDNQNLALCGNDCFAATYSHGTATYRSLGAARGVSLVYHGDRTAVRPFISADLTLAAGLAPPQQITLEARINGANARFLNGEDTLHFSGSGWQAGQTVRVAGQIDASGYATGMYPLQIIATAVYADHLEPFSVSTKLMVVNHRTPDILPVVGWTVAGVQRLHPQPDGTILVVGGDGSGSYFSCTSYSQPCAGPSGDFTKLWSSGSGGSLTYTRAYPDSTRVVFNSIGQMTQVVDRWGNAGDVEYSNGRITRILDPMMTYNGGGSRTAIEFWYNSGSFTIAMPGPRGTAATAARGLVVAYDGATRITSFQDPDGLSTALTYDGSGRLKTVTDRRGGLLTYNYDALSWKLTSVEFPQISVDNGSGGTQLAIPAVGYRAWQRVGIPISATVSNPAPLVRPDTIAALVVGAINDTTRVSVDRWGQPLRIVDPLGNTTTIFRNGIFATTVTNHLGHTDSYSYSGPFLTSTTPYLQPITTVGHDSYGMVSSVSGGNRPTVTRSYNAGPRTITETVAGSYTTTRYLDARGRDTLTTDPAGHQARAHYDATFGNLDSTTAAAGQWTRATFDAYGRDSVATASGQLANTRLYDLLGRDSLAYDGVNPQPTKLTYDALFLTTVRDAKGQVYRQDLNALGWPTDVYDPADTVAWSRKTSARYDVAGRVTRAKNRRDQWIAMQYDKVGRLTSRRDLTGLTPADSFRYSANGRIVVGANSISVDSIAFGDRGADTIVTTIAGQTFKRVHSATAGTTADTAYLSTSVTGMTLSNRMRFWSVSLGVLDSIKVGSSKIAFGYNAEMFPTTVQFASFSRTDSPTTTHQVYDRSYSTQALDTLFGRSYRYDAVGRITSESRINGYQSGWIQQVRDFAYAGPGELRRYETGQTFNKSCDPDYGCTLGGTTVQQTYGYTYDAVGNLSTEIDSTNGNATLTSNFDAGNRLRGWDGIGYDYDADGNRSSRSASGVTTAYGWSAGGRLRSVTSGSQTVEYGYNAFGELVRRSTNGVVDRHFVWDEGQLLLQLEGTATGRVGEYAYLPGVDQPLALITNNAVRFYQTDLRGNVIGLASGGQPVQHFVFSPWGVPEVSSGTALDTARLGWKGLMWEGSVAGLYYVRNRWYDPASRSFISEDPIGISGGINTYAFAGNDPVNYGDPEGLKTQTLAGVTIRAKRDCNFWNRYWCEEDDAGNSSSGAAPEQGVPGSGRSPGGSGGRQRDPFGASQPVACSTQNFMDARCAAIRGAIANLARLPGGCGQIGTNAGVRYGAGRYAYQMRQNRFLGLANLATGQVTIGDRTFKNRYTNLLIAVIAAEEYHMIRYRDDVKHTVGGQSHPAHYLGDACAELSAR